VEARRAVVVMPPLIAVGVNAEGHREILGIDVSTVAEPTQNRRPPPRH